MNNSKKHFLNIILSIFLIFSLIGCGDTKKEAKNDVKSNVVSSNKETKQETATKTDTSNSQVTDDLKIHYIDVGQADSILIQQNGHNMLIDAGNNEDSNLVVNYLKQQGVSKLDYAIGTHPHEDHIGGLDKVIDNFEIGQIFMPKKLGNTKTYKDVLTSVKNKNLKITAPVPGTTYKLGIAELSVFAPAKNKDYESINNYSIVQKLKFGNTSFIFTGDAEAISEMEMVKGGYDLHADVLKVGHHGSKTSTCQAFLDKVSPKYAVISCGKDNTYGHPNKSTMDKLKAKNIPVYRTDESGTMVVTSDGEKISFSTNPGSYTFKGNDTDTQTNKVVPINPVVKNSNNNAVNTNTSPVKKASKKPNVSQPAKNNSRQVWLSATGSKYHSIPNCGRMNPNRATKVSIGEAQSQGYGACSKCRP